jgi:hypothetical protein
MEATQWLRANLVNITICIMLVLAAAHCARSIYFSSVTNIDWKEYVAGKQPMPFQGRIGMMPVLRWAEHSAAMLRLAKKLDMSVEKFASFIAAAIALQAMVVASAVYSWRRGYKPWWLASVLVLITVAATLGLRYESNYWYPYDLPHAALFGLACLCILELRWVPFIVLFVLDIPVRETGVFLLVMAVSTWCYRAPRRAVVRTMMIVGVLSSYALVVRTLISTWFRANTNDVGHDLYKNFHLLSLSNWPQLFSAGGFFAVFVFWERGLLSPRERVFMWSCLACVPVTLYYGLWIESKYGSNGRCLWQYWELLSGANRRPHRYRRGPVKIIRRLCAQGCRHRAIAFGID